MKVIPKKDLIKILVFQFVDTDEIYKDDIIRKFERYGDDYFINRDYGKFELTRENEDRKELMKKIDKLIYEED